MIVCHCSAVSDRDIDRAVRDGARDVPSVVRACGAGGDCGGCHRRIRTLLAPPLPPLEGTVVELAPA